MTKNDGTDFSHLEEGSMWPVAPHRRNGQTVDSGAAAGPPASDGTAFEVAREILGELVAIAAAHLDAPAGPSSGAGTETWQQRHATWVEQLEMLRPGDRDAVNAVLQDCGPLLDSLRAEAS